MVFQHNDRQFYWCRKQNIQIKAVTLYLQLIRLIAHLLCSLGVTWYINKT